MIDTDNKVVVYQFMTGISEAALKQFKDSSKALIDKDYLVLAVDDTFEVSNIKLNDEDIDKAIKEWEKFKN